MDQSWDLGGSLIACPGLDQGGGTGMTMTKKDQCEHEKRRMHNSQGVPTDRKRKKREMSGMVYSFGGLLGKCVRYYL